LNGGFLSANCARNIAGPFIISFFLKIKFKQK